MYIEPRRSERSGPWSEYDPQARAAARLLPQGTARKWPGADVEDVFQLPPLYGGSDRANLRNITEDLANAVNDMDQARADRAEAAEGEDLRAAREQVDEVVTSAPSRVLGEDQAPSEGSGGERFVGFGPRRDFPRIALLTTRRAVSAAERALCPLTLSTEPRSSLVKFLVRTA